MERNVDIEQMINAGMSVKEIARQLNRPFTTILRTIRKKYRGCLIGKRLDILTLKARTLKAIGLPWEVAARYLNVSRSTYFRLLGRRIRTSPSIGIAIVLGNAITSDDGVMVKEGNYDASYFSPTLVLLRSGDVVHFVNVNDVVNNVEVL